MGLNRTGFFGAQSLQESRSGSARDFGISESCQARWLKIADREEGDSEAGGPDAGELRALKERNKLLEQENEILRRRRRI